MKRLLCFAAVIVVALLWAGCGTPLPPGTEKGPHDTIAYLVSVDASPPGARIEANGDSVGNTPVTIKIFAERDRTFHNFGANYYTVRAYPLASNQNEQARYFGTGRQGTQKGQVPGSIYFDMSQPTPPPPPPPPPKPVYYPAYYYYPPPYYYGPPVYYYHYYGCAPYHHH